MTAFLPYRFRWNRFDRKGEPCRVTARSRPTEASVTPLLAFGHTARPRFNSVRLEFADGFTAITSGNAIARRQ